MHQGADGFSYTMQIGHLDAGEEVRARISSLSATMATPEACVGPAEILSATQLGALGDAIRNAPIFIWPRSKRFDDLPVVVGWSARRRAYETIYTNENGGTTVLCGGGARGMQAEIARWSRGFDLEGMYNYSTSSPLWERCTATTTFAAVMPRIESAHPILYYGDGHNRLFENRGGYGNASGCGTSGDNRADGDIVGWNTANPGNDAAHDADFTITVRPMPVELDPLGYASFRGRREALVDHYAPWVYRLTDSELHREGKIDGVRTFGMDSYLYADIHATDVGGSGDPYCATPASGGFTVTSHPPGSAAAPNVRITASFFGAPEDWKRAAIPLGRTYTTAELSALSFEGLDADGVFLLGIGDVFVARPVGDNGARLEYVHRGNMDTNVFVGADTSSCVNGVNTDGPGGIAYRCVGPSYRFAL
jgi:hypothetical protein